MTGPARDAAQTTAEEVALERLVSVECLDTNLRRLRYTSPLAVLMHALSVWRWRHVPTAPEELRRWATNLWWLNLVMLGAGLVSTALVYGRHLPAWLVRWRRHLPTLAVMGYVVWGALVSANVQVVRPNVEAYTYLSLGVGVTLLVSVEFLVVAQALAVLILVVAQARTQSDRALLSGQVLNVLSVAVVGVMMGRVVERSFRQQVRDRLTIEQQKASLESLNRELEARVEAKVRAALEQARELAHLHGRLQEKVRERSRELARALSKVSGERLDQALLRSGTVLGERVQIVRPLAAGGMGMVYEGHDLVTQEPVAVKVVPPSQIGNLDTLHRFLRESLAAASVTHPGVVRTLHVDVSSEGMLFQVQERLVGASLRQALDGGRRFTTSAAARLGADAAGALAAAHAAGVVHRDIKPGNIMLTRREPGVVLIDFGISRLSRDQSATLTHPGQVLGTPEYLSPEQVTAPNDVEPATDIYSLGTTLYRMLAGESPFGVLSPMQFLEAHVNRAPRDLAELVPDVPADMARAVMDCLHKSPSERPDARGLQERLCAIADAAAEVSSHALAARWFDEQWMGDSTRTGANLPAAQPAGRRSSFPPRAQGLAPAAKLLELTA